MRIGGHQPEIDAFLREHFPKTAAEPHKNGQAHGAPTLEDDEIIQLCRKATNAPKFASLYDDGDIFAYDGDDSVADAALVSILAFYTQDFAQLERLWRDSALGQREKFNRADYRRRTIDFVLGKLTAIYQPGDDGARLQADDDERHRHRHSNRGSDGDGSENGAKQKLLTSVSFAEIAEPEPVREVVEDMLPEGWPAIFFGAAGAVKSIKAQSLGQAIADPNTRTWLGRKVVTSPVMYADFELNVEAQARRAYQIARGRGRVKPPAEMRYMSTHGIPRKQRKDFLKNVVDECVEHGAKICFIDSIGLAIQGDAGKFEAVVAMFEEDLATFAGAGITALMIGHQRRVQPGERSQSLGVYGSVFHENLARAVVQVEFVSRDRENHTVLTRLRPKKANFSELREPLEVKTTFHTSSAMNPGVLAANTGKITLEATEIEDLERAGEETLNAKDRVLAAVRALGEAGPDEITEACQTLKRPTVRNALTKLREEGLVENTGELEGRAHKVRVTVTVPFSSDGDGDGSVQKLIAEGMSPKFARDAVLGEDQ